MVRGRLGQGEAPAYRLFGDADHRHRAHPHRQSDASGKDLLDDSAAIAGIATGLTALGGHHGNWLRYRATAEALRKLRVHRELGLRPYDGEGADDRFIEEAERLLAGEQEVWQRDRHKSDQTK